MVRDQADFNALSSFGQQNRGKEIWLGLKDGDKEISQGGFEWVDGTRRINL